MKKYTSLFVFLILVFSFISCEKVIDVDLNTAAPRLVIDAALKWEKGTDGATQKIVLSTTTGYFDQTIPKVSGATVLVTNSNEVDFIFLETVPNSGEYICSNFIPVLDETYVLTIVLNGVTYTATETLNAVPSIDKIEQKDNAGVLGNNIEVKFFYTDNGLKDEFYLYRHQLSTYAVPEYRVSSDDFYNGNQFFSRYSNEDIKKDDTIDFTLSAISEGYFNYLQVLLDIAGSASGGGPFQSPPATVRGNIINTTDSNNYALGFFSVSETAHVLYVVQ